jgi:hypothetical protein
MSLPSSDMLTNNTPNLWFLTAKILLNLKFCKALMPCTSLSHPLFYSLPDTLHASQDVRYEIRNFIAVSSMVCTELIIAVDTEQRYNSVSVIGCNADKGFVLEVRELIYEEVSFLR